MLHGREKYLISNYKKLKPKEVDGLVGNCNWANISLFGELSIDFIEKFQQRIIWEKFSTNRNMTEEILLKYRERLDLFFVFQYHQFSEKFLIDNLGKFNKNLGDIINSQHNLTPPMKEKIKLIMKLGK